MTGTVTPGKELSMRKWSKRINWQLVAVVVVVAAALIAAPSASARHGKHKDRHGRDRNLPSFIMAFTTMYGVDGPFVNPANAIRNIPGDEDPWKLTSARGFLGTDGHLQIRMRGLIFADGRPNDDDTFRGAVSCLTEDEAAGTTPIANVFTQGFPASPAGDSDIDAQLTLPNPCIAPVIFVLGGDEDKWFAVTGFESDGDSTSNGGDDDDDDDHHQGDDDDDDQGEDD